MSFRPNEPVRLFLTWELFAFDCTSHRRALKFAFQLLTTTVWHMWTLPPVNGVCFVAIVAAPRYHHNITVYRLALPAWRYSDFFSMIVLILLFEETVSSTIWKFYHLIDHGQYYVLQEPQLWQRGRAMLRVVENFHCNVCVIFANDSSWKNAR